MAARRLSCIVVAASFFVCLGYGQSGVDAEQHPGPPQTSIDQGNGQPDPLLGSKSADAMPKRIFGIIPNYRTTASLENYKPIPPKEKFELAREDSFDPGTLVLGAMFAGLGQAANSSPSFGRGVAAYPRYFATSYADFVIANYMTEGIYSSILHEDPRYFRRGAGRVWSRLGSAVGQTFWTHTDSVEANSTFPKLQATRLQRQFQPCIIQITEPHPQQ